jgi:uncharacterized membrane protein (UPF0127 family)
MTTYVSFGDLSIRCAVATTPAQWSVGLQRHASLGADEGLLFLFDEPRSTTFHMGQVAFPIDIVGLIRDEDAAYRVARIVEDAQPGTTDRWHFVDVDAVLEVPAGTCRGASIYIGDRCARQAQKTAQTVDPFSADDVFDDDEVSSPDSASSPQLEARAELRVGDQFKVGRFGPTWTVTQAHGASGYAQKDRHVRKWFGYSHNRETNEIAVYPVKQGSGDRIGDPVAYGPLNLLEFGSGVRQASDVLNRGHEQVERHPSPTVTVPGGADEDFDDAPKEEYFSLLYGDALAGEALDVDEALQTRVGRACGREHARSAQVVDEAKFVEKVARVLSVHAQNIPWAPDTLNDGATERAVVTRSELARWLTGGSEVRQGTAAPEAVQYILQAAGDARGLQLIGTACVLAGIADFTRLAHKSRDLALVLYRGA